MLLEDINTYGIIINKLKVVKKQLRTYLSLRGGDVILLVYRKNEPDTTCHTSVNL